MFRKKPNSAPPQGQKSSDDEKDEVVTKQKVRRRQWLNMASSRAKVERRRT